MELTAEQIIAKDMVLDWLDNSDEQVLVIGGYAGTGKTTIGRWLQDNIGGTMFSAFTGKAVNVLRQKGCIDVQTIHARIYRPAKRDKGPLEALQDQLKEAQDLNQTFLIPELETAIEEMEEEMAKPTFVKNEKEVQPFIVIDEYSMLNQEMIADLKEVYEKILCLGDPAQLGPVGKTERSKQDAICPLVPAFTLTEVHRQAEGSGILHAASLIRQGGTPQFCDWGDFRYIPRDQLTEEDMVRADQIIVGRNATRHDINNWFREREGRAGRLPQAGEKMMCLRNFKELGLFNGMEVTVAEDAINSETNREAYMCKFKGINLPEQMKMGETNPEQPLSCWRGELVGEQFKWANKALRGLKQFTFCHAITCHKSQGSEYNEIIVFHEPLGKNAEEMARWLYTAITRGKLKVTLVQP